jgi:hypothetical protein
MENNTSEQMASRVALLEKETRELRRRANIAFGLALSCVFMSFLVIADGVRRKAPNTLVVSRLEAEDVRVRNRAGGSSIVLGRNVDGQQAISFLNDKGVSLIRIGVTPDGLPAVGLFDTAGVVRASFGLVAQRGRVASTIDFREVGGNVRLTLGLSEGDLPEVIFKDRAGEGRLGIMVTGDDVATLLLSSRRAGENFGVRLQCSADGEPAIDFLNGFGRVVRLPVKER